MALQSEQWSLDLGLLDFAGDDAMVADGVIRARVSLEILTACSLRGSHELIGTHSARFTGRSSRCPRSRWQTTSFSPPLVSNQSLSPLDRASRLKTDRDVSEPEFLSFVASCEFPGTQETR